MSADLRLAMTASPQTALAGSNVTFTITATNAGPSTASTVTVWDTLPAPFTFVSCSSTGGGVCRGSGRNRKVTFTSIAAGAAPVVTIVAQLPTTVAHGKVLQNRARISSTKTSDPNTSNNLAVASVTAVRPRADLDVKASASPDPVLGGSQLTATFTVRNLGPQAAASVAVSVTLPPGTTLASCTATGGVTCGGSSTAPTVSYTSIAAGTEQSVTIVATVKTSVSDGATLATTTSATTTTVDPVAGNNSATAVVTASLSSADLALTQTASPDPTSPGSDVTFTVTVANAGPRDASVELAEDLPPGTTFVSCTPPSDGTCGGADLARTASFTSLPADSARTVVWVARVDSSAADRTVLLARARVLASSPPDPDSTNDAADGLTTVLAPGANLAVGATALPDPVPLDSALTYTITVENKGSVAAADVVVEDELPSELDFASCAATGAGVCAGAANSRSIAFPGLEPGASETVTLVGDLNGSATAGSLVRNTVRVRSSTADTDAADDSTTVAVTAGEGAPRYDLVLIVTDDQATHTMQFMPRTRALIGDAGVRFTRGYVTTPLCCPSRASFLTGLYSHNHGVLKNDAPAGGATAFDDRSTLATWLQAAGYRTGLFGKYLNQYEDLAPSPYEPPGWDEWHALIPSNGYHRYQMVENGSIVSYDSTSGLIPYYSTDVAFRRAVEFVESAPAEQPIFVYVTPYAPHPPALPAREDRGAFAALPPWRTESFNEQDVSDKPFWVRNLPLFTQAEQDSIDALYRRQVETLKSVDRGVADLVAALERAGRLHRTAIVFTSDNGWSGGAHRWDKKGCPYEECVGVPFLVRAPGIAPRTDDHLVLNIDLAPTFAEWAGATPPGAVNGASLTALLADPRAPWRDAVLFEMLYDSASKAFYGVRTDRYLYTEYGNGDRELYDFTIDPGQLQNRVNDPAYADAVAELDARLEALKRE